MQRSIGSQVGKPSPNAKLLYPMQRTGKIGRENCLNFSVDHAQPQKGH
jgi:hypothetical protein